MLADTTNPRQLSLFAEDMIDGRIRDGRFVASRPSVTGIIANAVAATIARVARWQRCRAIEAELRGLSDHMLSDIGLTRGDISRAAAAWSCTEKPAEVRRSEPVRRSADAVMPLPATQPAVAAVASNDDTRELAA